MDDDELGAVLRPHISEAIKAAESAGETPAGFALVLPLLDENPNALTMYIAGGLFGEDAGSPENIFRILGEALAFLLSEHTELLGPLLPETFNRLVSAAGGTIETVHVEAPDTVPEPESPLQRWAKRRRG